MRTPRPAAVPVPYDDPGSRRRPGRTPTRLGAVAFGVALVLSSGPAMADVPMGWPDPPEITLLDGLAIYVFLPAGLFALVVLLALAPSLARGERPSDRTRDDQWFGGRRGGHDELESGTPAKGSGGASGSW